MEDVFTDEENKAIIQADETRKKKLNLGYGTLVGMGLGVGMGAFGAASSDGSANQVTGSIIGGTGDVLLDYGADQLGKHINKTTKNSSEIIKNQLLKEASEYFPNDPKKAAKFGEKLLQMNKDVNFTQAKNAVKTAKTALAAAKTAAKTAASEAAKTGATAAAKSMATKTAGIVAAKQSALITSRLTATAAALAPTGPIGWIVEAVLFIVQMIGVAIDMTWNPFKTYFNKDLDELKDTIDSSLRKQSLESRGQEYPLELKPNVIPMNDDEQLEFNKYIREYYVNNGLVFPEEADQADQLMSYLDYLERERYVLYNPLKLLDSTQQNISMLVAAALRKQYDILGKAVPIRNPSPFKPITDWLQYNWQLPVLFSTCLSISIIFILILSIS